MIRLLPTLTALVLGCSGGYLVRRSPFSAYWQSIASLALGWAVALTTLIVWWLFWPPETIAIVAVGFGLAEAALGVALTIVIGSAVHFLLIRMAAKYPAVGPCRTSLMGFVGAVIGALPFMVWIVHPVE
jgi:hypothetical protein